MFLLLIGCLLREKGPVEETGAVDTADTDATDTEDTDVDTPSDAYGCIESSRTPLTDTSVPAAGMAFAPDAAVAAFSGAWNGTFHFVEGEAQPATLTVASGGTWELVSRELFDGGGLGEGAPAEECGSYYAWSTEATFADTSGAFDEHFLATLDVFAPDRVNLFGFVAIDSVVGTTRPTGWDPAEWARNTLVVSGDAFARDWNIQVMWQASSGADAKDDGVSVETGVVEPSGMVEFVGNGTLTPIEE